MLKQIKNILIAIGILFLLVILAGVYKFDYLSNKEGYNVDGNKIEQRNINRNDDLCDENGKRYLDEEEARQAGLSEAEFGATYCPEYKMHPSWDRNKDGINDCYEGNSCSAGLDYMAEVR